MDRSSLECQSGHATGHGWWWVRYILVNDEVSNLNIFYNYPICNFFLLQLSLTLLGVGYFYNVKVCGGGLTDHP